MIRSIIIFFGRRKNASFHLHPSVKSGVLAGYLKDKTVSWIRGIKLIFCSRHLLLFCGRGLKIAGSSQARFGRGVQLGDGINISAWGHEGLSIGDYTWIGSYSCLKVSFSFTSPGQYIRIGRNVGIGEFAHLGGAGGLEISDDCIIGPYFSCHPENHRFPELTELIRLQGTERNGIYIGKNCWIGAKVTVLDGVHIGDNCVIAAGAVVTKNMPDNAVIGGVPAKVLRLRNTNTDPENISKEMLA